MAETATAYVRLDGDAGVIFSAWQERSHEIFLAEGVPLDPLRDGLPLLVATIHDMRPRLNPEERKILAEEIWRAFEESMRFVHGEAEGEA